MIYNVNENGKYKTNDTIKLLEEGIHIFPSQLHYTLLKKSSLFKIKIRVNQSIVLPWYK